MKSCVYDGIVFHTRHQPVRHAFRAPLFLMYLDLEEIDAICEQRLGWSAKGFSPTQFRRADYLGDAGTELAEAVRKRVEEAVGKRPLGPIRLLTQLRYWGFSFNPVSFYYCYTADGQSVDWIVAEVTNIPWRERHAYVVPFEQGSARLEKRFFVSPYLPMDLNYEWRFDVPGAELNFAMDCHREGHRLFEARLAMQRRPLDEACWGGVWWRHPWMGARTVASIYWQALQLRRKGAPVYTHPVGGR